MATQSEDARKKLRVERLKRQTATQEIAQNQVSLATSISNPNATEWDKLHSLKHIELMRESKKHTLLERVLKESLACKQTVDVVTGQPTLIHFLVSNPFPQDEVFQIIIQGDEPAPRHEL